VVQRFGIRELRFDPAQGFFLNGRHVRLHGMAMHQDQLGKGWALTDADLDASLALFTEVGANAIRLGHYPFPRHALERVSELGLVAWAEKPSGLRTRVGSCDLREPTEEFMENARQQLRELIRQQYNHAAVALWSIGNETTAGHIGCEELGDNATPYLRELHRVAKEEDPTRPTIYAEFPHPVSERRRIGPFVTEGITDLYATNRYFGWYHEPLEIERLGPLLDTLHALAEGQPVAVSEYGAGAALTHHTDDPRGGEPEVHSSDEGEPTAMQPEEYQAWVHEQNWRTLESKPYLWGTFAWNMFDFGSANRREGDVLGVNTKGLVSFDRRTRKDAFFFYKANWSAEPVTHIVGRRYVDRAYAVVDVKVYSNAESVDLSVNGEPAGTLTAERCEQRTCLFEDVRLPAGDNRVTAAGRHGDEVVTDSVEWSLNQTDVNIASGMLWTGHVASDGARFGSDAFFVGGTPGHVGSGDPEAGLPEGIEGTADPMLFKFFRAGEFRYEIPLDDGQYEVTLGFIEPDEEADAGERVFTVRANGAPLLEDFDVLEEAGEPRTAITRTFTVPVSGGRLVLEYEASQGDALSSHIRIRRRP
jgi:beta-galactosidase